MGPIPEEERKEIIYECSKLLGMKYTPPPLNEAATSAVRKNDAALYGIQMALATLTRRIGDYVHRKLKNPNTMIQGNEDLEFAHTMRELLSDVGLSITQSIINNLHKLVGLPEKRKSSSIERLVKIKVHSDEILCPVIAYKIYKQRIANIPCPRPHVKKKKGITPNARAIESTIAARTGISTDAILTQAYWPSYYMFSSYYKVSNILYSNISESVFSEST
ncbi:hypothetical protein BB561_006679 [Smittium simulii]|uniref:Uncharacterized protein n=1 Tax=Smittium simulii TaxID=133385 RepID=A0A2T9Y2F2_9FUNG|nr:hypothetical protein BB561_006679 [Smittium simulii]